MHVEEKKRSKRVQFDEKFLDVSGFLNLKEWKQKKRISPEKFLTFSGRIDKIKKVRTLTAVPSFQWQPRKITPKMDSFVELTPQEVEEDEQKLKKKQLQQTPISSTSLLKSTPASSTSQQNGSIKKVRKARYLRKKKWKRRKGILEKREI